MFCTAVAFCVLSPTLGGSHLVLPPVSPDALTRADDHGNVAIAVRDGQRTVEPGGAGRALGAASWEAIGPFGGDVSDVAASTTAAGVVLAGLAPSTGSGGTMFRSTDGGASWSEVTALSGLSVYDIELAPDGTAYAGTMDSVYKSTDDGATWTQQNLGIGLNDQTLEVTIDPNNPLRIWAGVADALGSQTNTLMLSTDGGNTWVSKTPAGGPYGFSAIAVNPTDSNKVYAAWGGSFGGGGIFVSSNGGTTWTDRTGVLPTNPMQDLAHDGTRLLLTGGQLFGGQIVGIWTTSNDGVTWTELSNASWPLRVFHDLELEPGNPSHILAASVGNGVYESLDGGATWAFGVGGTGGLSSNEVSYDPLNAATIYVGSSSNAVWKSTNGGSSYGASSLGIGQLNVYSIATSPTNPLEVAIAYQGLNDGGVQTSLDGGLSWTGESVPGTRWNTVRFDETGTLYALSDGPTTIAPEAAYRRSGGVWTCIGPDQGSVFETEAFAITFEPGNPSTIILGGSDFGVAGHEPTCWKTTDLGATWTKTWEGTGEDFEDVLSIEYLLGGVDVLVGAFDDFNGVQDGGAIRSADSGASWVKSSTGLATECQGWDLDVVSDGSKVYLADADTGTGNGGLYESVDGGLTWSLTNGVGTTYHVASHPYVTDTLFTTHYSAPKARSSEDDGATLSDFSTGLSTSAYMRGQHLNATGTWLYVATSEGSWRTAVDVGGTGTGYCFGDGTGDPCPCGNTGGAGEGCANSTGSGGLLVGTGSLSVTADDLGFDASGLLPGQGALLFVANNQLSGLYFGDGLRCAGGALKRLGVRIPNASGAAHWGPGLAAAGGWSAGDVRNFQLWYRDPVNSPCSNEFNTSNGVNAVFVP